MAPKNRGPLAEWGPRLQPIVSPVLDPALFNAHQPISVIFGRDVVESMLSHSDLLIYFSIHVSALIEAGGLAALF